MKVSFINAITLFSLFSFSNVMASTVTFNMDIIVNSDSEFPSLSPSEGGTGIFPGSTHLDGLPQFDLSLGTLNKATFISAGDFSYSLSSDLPPDPFFNSVIDEAAPNSMSMNPQLGIGLAEGFSISTFPVASPAFSCSANAFEGACIANMKDVLPTSFLLEKNSGSYRFDDLSGTGDLGYLRIELFASNDTSGVVNNIENDIVLIGMSYDGTVSVEYDFTPVPVPAAAWLFGSALVGGLIGMRKKSTISV